LGRWALGVSIPRHEKEVVSEIEWNIGVHVCIVNDIFSWAKELIDEAELGIDIVNAVAIVMHWDNVDVATAQAKLAAQVLEIEAKHY